MSGVRSAMSGLGAIVLGGSLMVGGTAAAAGGDPVVFPSTVLRDCINTSLGQSPGDTITEAQAASISTLTCPGVENLEGAQYLTGLVSIDISDGLTMNYSALRNLPVLDSVTAVRMKVKLAPIPVGRQQANSFVEPGFNPLSKWSPAVGPAIPATAVVFDTDRNWTFTEAHTAVPGETTLLFNQMGPTRSPDLGNYFVDGIVTQSAYYLTPVIDDEPNDVTAAIGTTASFTAAASTEIQTPTVQWQQQVNGTWQDIAGATSATYAMTPVTAAMNGTVLRAVFTNGDQSTLTRQVTLRVVGPAEFVTQPTDQVAATRGTAIFTAQVHTDSATPTGNWQFSADGGATWTPIDQLGRGAGVAATTSNGQANGAPVWQARLELTTVPREINGWLVRFVMSDEYTSPAKESRAAALTVTAEAAAVEVVNTSPATTRPLAVTGTTILPVAIVAGVLILAGASVIIVRRRKSS